MDDVDHLTPLNPINNYRYGFPVSDEQVRSSKRILKSFAENVSRSQVGRLECGQNKILVNLFLAENKKMIELSGKQKSHMRSVSQVEKTPSSNVTNDPLSAFSTISQSINLRHQQPPVSLKGVASQISTKLSEIAGGNPITEMLLQKRLSNNSSLLDLSFKSTSQNPEMVRDPSQVSIGRNGMPVNGGRYSLNGVESRKELRGNSPIEIGEEDLEELSIDEVDLTNQVKHEEQSFLQKYLQKLKYEQKQSKLSNLRQQESNKSKEGRTRATNLSQLQESVSRTKQLHSHFENRNLPEISRQSRLSQNSDYIDQSAIKYNITPKGDNSVYSIFTTNQKIVFFERRQTTQPYKFAPAFQFQLRFQFCLSGASELTILQAQGGITCSGVVQSQIRFDKRETQSCGFFEIVNGSGRGCIFISQEFPLEINRRNEINF